MFYDRAFIGFIFILAFRKLESNKQQAVMKKRFQLTGQIDVRRLLKGDVLIGHKSDINWVKHYAIYGGLDREGHPFVFENTPVYGVRMLLLADFFKEYVGPFFLDSYSFSTQEREQIVWRAAGYLNEPYHLTNFNCETYINLVLSGEPISKQVNNVGVGLALGFLGLLVVAAVKK